MAETSGSPGGAGEGEPGTSEGYSGNHRDISQHQDPADRNRYRRRKRRRTLPSQFAEFKLADGRTLRDVLGDGFFGAARPSVGGKWMSKGVRERLLKGDRPRTIGLGWLKPGMEPANNDGRSRRMEQLRQRAEERRNLAESQRAALRERIGQWRANRKNRRLPEGGGS